MTHGYLESSIRLVVAPPRDQAHIDRLGVMYMGRIKDPTDLVPVADSPVLQRPGLTSTHVLDGDGKPGKTGEWVNQRIIKNLGDGTESARIDNV
ncbi:uncharacterized protein N0V89_002524 [Didymosphaeria variabile]|uniref:Uncharacterized protein n=1 Tax=Didymosphaeria variabile TaxID=1932322 RepID=A0A9W8XUZ3_9PLEO|nr:uncharacterized protein N0V89_002524 [Didymosphaeria variabile]KAJ4357947.1 hypothetical protein N0V89_002524 [Didymosphaeria variabile]